MGDFAARPNPNAAGDDMRQWTIALTQQVGMGRVYGAAIAVMLQNQDRVKIRTG
ncbi:MAG: hypothetical protein ACO4AI_08525 [Prochlorothrix sp.]